MLNTAYRGSDFFTESKNFDPLSSTGLSKLPPLRVFMRKITNFSISEKLYIIWNKKSHKTTSRADRWPKLAILANFGAWKLSAKKPNKKCQKKKRDFFQRGDTGWSVRPKNLYAPPNTKHQQIHGGDFWNISGLFPPVPRSKFWLFQRKHQNFDLKTSRKRPKMKTSKIPCIDSQTDILYLKAHTNFQANYIPSSSKKKMFPSKKISYIFRDYRENTLRFSDRQISIVRSWEIVEPILEYRKIGL